jgi:hypothetical protein
MNFHHISIGHEGPVAIVTLNRPQRRNALSLELMLELLACLDQLGRNPDVRAVILAAPESLCQATTFQRPAATSTNTAASRRLQRARDEASGHSAAGDSRSAGHRHRRGMPTGGRLRPGSGGRRGGIRHTRRKDRPVLHHPDGGPDAPSPETRAPDAHGRAGGCANGAEWGLVNQCAVRIRRPRAWPPGGRSQFAGGGHRQQAFYTQHLDQASVRLRQGSDVDDAGALDAREGISAFLGKRSPC